MNKEYKENYSIALSVGAMAIVLSPVAVFVMPEIAEIAKTDSLTANAALVFISIAYCFVASALVQTFGTSKYFKVPLARSSGIPEHAMTTDDFIEANGLRGCKSNLSHPNNISSDVARGVWDSASPYHGIFK